MCGLARANADGMPRPGMEAYALTSLSLVYGAVLLVDRMTKLWAVAHLTLGMSIPLVPFLHLTLVHNHGAAFGLFVGLGPLLILVRLVVSVGVFIVARRLPGANPAMLVGLGLVGAGAAGNLVDALAYGYVVDFLDIRVWPVFNVADMAIVCGSMLLALQFVLYERRGGLGS